MEDLITISYWLVGAIVLYWVISFVLVCVVMKIRILLTPRPEVQHEEILALTEETFPKLSVIVAAKDEETNIEACVRTMLDQDYPNYELIVVDDRSDDRTPEILQQLQETSPEFFKVIRIEELEDGWFGKNNAMREGIAQSSGDWFCFIDADCWQTSRQTLSITMQEVLTTKIDFLSVTPDLNMVNAWEKVIQPACVLTLLAWHFPGFVNDSRRKTAYANGQFMMMSRACYEKIGGHERVKNEMNEDILLARNTQAAGLQLRMADNVGLFRTRMYEGISGAYHGWSRIFCGCIRSAPALLLTIFIVLFYVLSPWIFLAASVIGRVTSGAATPWNQLVLLWSGVCIVQLLFSLHYSSNFKMKKIWSVAFPLGGLFTLTTLVNGLFKRLGLTHTTWRGTTYSLTERIEQKPRVDQTQQVKTLVEDEQVRPVNQ